MFLTATFGGGLKNDCAHSPALESGRAQREAPCKNHNRELQLRGDDETKCGLHDWRAHWSRYLAGLGEQADWCVGAATLMSYWPVVDTA